MGEISLPSLPDHVEEHSPKRTGSRVAKRGVVKRGPDETPCASRSRIISALPSLSCVSRLRERVPRWTDLSVTPRAAVVYTQLASRVNNTTSVILPPVYSFKSTTDNLQSRCYCQLPNQHQLKKDLTLHCTHLRYMLLLDVVHNVIITTSMLTAVHRSL